MAGDDQNDSGLIRTPLCPRAKSVFGETSHLHQLVDCWRNACLQHSNSEWQETVSFTKLGPEGMDVPIIKRIK
jgi:hypothetical protein